jgi:LysM repeat protein
MTNTSYKIAYGDTLGGIASKNGLSVQDIVAANPTIKDPNKISAGTSLVIPTKAPATAATPATTPTTAPSDTYDYNYYKH